MDFLLADTREHSLPLTREVGGLLLSYELNHRISEREFIIEDNTFLILGDTNLSFAAAIKDNPVPPAVTANIGLLTNGFVIVVDKMEGTLGIHNDIFGFYPVYYMAGDRGFPVSNRFEDLYCKSSGERDIFATVDLLLFNYTLLNRTIISDIKRLKGGSTITFSGSRAEVVISSNFADNFRSGGALHSFSPGDAGQVLVDNIARNIDGLHANTLLMSGGFDSRLLLAACKNAAIPVITCTFGQPGSIEQEIVKTFIGNFSEYHYFFELDSNYLKDLPKTLGMALSATPGSPSVQDLVHYAAIRNDIKGSNLIAGFMGGEIITGQSLGAGVTFTRSAFHLLASTDPQEFGNLISSEIEALKIFDGNEFEKIKEEYAAGLSCYLATSGNNNVLRFMVNEKYAKFFGLVNMIFRNHSNLITPFMSGQYLSYMLNSSKSILKTRMINISPRQTIKGRIACAEMIALLCPGLKETRFDRLYRVKDLSLKYRIPLAVLMYFLNHLAGRNRKMYLRPHHYDLWYRDIIIREFIGFDFRALSPLIISSLLINEEIYDDLTPCARKAWANLLGLKLAADRLPE